MAIFTENAAILDIELSQGTTIQIPITIFENDGSTPINLTGAVITSMIRQRHGDATPLATFSITSLDLVNGGFTLELSSAITAGLSFDSGVWDLEILFPSGVTTRYLKGAVVLKLEVSY